MLLSDEVKSKESLNAIKELIYFIPGSFKHNADLYKPIVYCIFSHMDVMPMAVAQAQNHGYTLIKAFIENVEFVPWVVAEEVEMLLIDIVRYN